MGGQVTACHHVQCRQPACLCYHTVFSLQDALDRLMVGRTTVVVAHRCAAGAAVVAVSQASGRLAICFMAQHAFLLLAPLSSWIALPYFDVAALGYRRLSTVRDADSIAVVFRGKIIEQGAHEEVRWATAAAFVAGANRSDMLAHVHCCCAVASAYLPSKCC